MRHHRPHKPRGPGMLRPAASPSRQPVLPGWRCPCRATAGTGPAVPQEKSRTAVAPRSPRPPRCSRTRSSSRPAPTRHRPTGLEDLAPPALKERPIARHHHRLPLTGQVLHHQPGHRQAQVIDVPHRAGEEPARPPPLPGHPAAAAIATTVLRSARIIPHASATTAGASSGARTPAPAPPADPATSQASVGSQAAASADTPVIGGVLSTADAAPTGHHRQISPPMAIPPHQPLPPQPLRRSATSPRNSETRGKYDATILAWDLGAHLAYGAGTGTTFWLLTRVV